MVSDGQLIQYKVNDWDSHIITTTAQIDGNTSPNRSACGFGALEQQYEYLYAFDGLLPSD